MKTLVISDLHLTHVFDEKKYDFLMQLFSSYDHIVLNGDFWDGFTTTFDRFVTSQWSSLFSVQKQKNAVYLYGNHDKEEYCDSRTSLFSATQTHEYSFQESGVSYHVEHGDRYAPGVDVLFPSSFRTVLKYVNICTHAVEFILVSLGNPQNLFLEQANSLIKRRLKKQNFTDWFLCGHTHVADYDETRKFANSGFVQYGKATYLVIDSSGVELKKERYK